MQRSLVNIEKFPRLASFTGSGAPRVMAANRRVVDSKIDAIFRSPAPQRLQMMCYEV